MSEVQSAPPAAPMMTDADRQTSASQTRRMSRNFAALTAGQFIARGLAVITNIYLARVLGAEFFGVAAFAITILSYPELIVNAGFLRLGPREIVRNHDPNAIRRLVRAVITVRLVLSFIAVAAFVLIVAVLPETTDLERSTIFIYGLVLFLVVIDLGWVFLGIEAMHIVSLADIIMQVITVIATLTLIRQPDDLPLVAIIYVVAQMVSVGMMFFLYTRRYGMPGLGVPAAVWRPLMKAAFPLAITRSMATLNLNFDSLLVGIVMSSYATGQYAAAYRFIWVPALLAGMYFSTVTPAFDRAFRGGFASIDVMINRSIRLTGAVGIGFAVAGTILAPRGFDLLYGAEYHDAVLPFQILIWAMALLFINRNFRTLLVSFDRQGAQVRLMGLSSATNVGLNLLLIPRYGLPGAAVATVAGELVNVVFGYWFVHRFIGHVPLGRHLPRLGALALITGGALYIALDMPLGVQIIVGGVAYIGGVIALHVVALEDVMLLVQAWRPNRKQVSKASAP